MDAPVVALTHVRVIDGTGGPIANDQTVVIANGRIQAVGRTGAVQVPGAARVLDLSGHTVFPGFVGMHDHIVYETTNRIVSLGFSAPRLYFASGVTTIKTTGAADPYGEINIKREIDQGRSPGPRMHLAGPHITGGRPWDLGNPGNRVLWMRHVSTPEEARRVVDYWADEGATFFKVYTDISRRELAAVIDQAHKRGLKVSGHLCSVTFREAVALGIDLLEHGLTANTDYHPRKVPDVCPPDRAAGLAELDLTSEAVKATFRDMMAKGVGMTSNLAGAELAANLAPMDERVVVALSPETLAEALAARANIAATQAEARQLFKQRVRYEMEFVKAGGLLMGASDPNGLNLPGFGDQREFELLVQAGLTPAQVVQIMSANGAKVLGVLDSLGTVTQGKLADLIVIQGDPATNPADIKRITIVFKDGVGYDSAKLIASVRGLVGVR
ncbi:MAG: amidohydrolase family protein [Gemmatimonadetes bacterium]|nr:amidohydrolase family protein [Gemmatimonadota bacterium]